VFVNPKDKRYTKFVGKKAELPIFKRTVPILEDESVDMEFGTGVVYLCTYGDEQDIRWQKKFKLPVIESIGETGRMTDAAGEYKGMAIEEARKQIIEDLKKEGRVKRVEDMQHNALCHTERNSCQTPIELLPLEQWFIKTREYLPEIKKAARTMKWYPDYMLGRLEDWCDSMDWDWIVSRQRVWGTPIPFWTCKRCGEVIPAKKEELPADPRGTTRKCKCGGEATGEKDVCDCWIDSSVSPLMVTKWGKDERFFKRTYPAYLRPQGYEIIRTWTFYTIFRNLLITGKPCFKDLMINGMIAGADGRKMSKSLGNIIAPEEVLGKYTADAIRQWAAAGSLGEDYPFSWEECEHSQKFLTKLWNVSRFVEGHLQGFKEGGEPELRDVDRWILSKLQGLIEECRKGLDGYVFNLPLQGIRSFIWHEFADYYLEMVKHRLYKPEIYGEDSRYAAQYTLRTVLETVLKLLAPVTPHITEEIYSELFSKESIHKTEYPKVRKELVDEKAEEAGKLMVEITDRIRAYKTEKSMSLGAELEKGEIEVPKGKLELAKIILDDIKGAGRIKELELKPGNHENVGFHSS
ncbi:MAG: class I tRNA ligase family protein, partial [Candidatus Altiarchaeota archaeon]|nr:class I tRNA ligase family protein [Candidatus Altiarchaeota archaeon]